MKNYYECKHCLKKYVNKNAYEKHECKQMQRKKLLKTPIGMEAFESYRKWMNTQKRPRPDKEQFIDSKFFVSFYKFSKFSNKVALPGKDKFIEYMVKLDIAPKDWSQNLVYDHYIQEFEHLHTPEEQANISVDTVFELANIFECEPNEIFMYIEPTALIRVVQAKKLSPWFLLVSSKFLWFLENEMTREQRTIIKQYLPVGKWSTLFDKHPEVVKKIKAYVRALEL